MKSRFFILLTLVLVGVFFFIKAFKKKPLFDNYLKGVETPNALNKTSSATNSVIELGDDFEFIDDHFGEYSLFEKLELNELDDILLHARNPNDFDRSIDHLKINGFTIIDQIDRLGSYRVKVNDIAKFSKFLTKQENDFELHKNVTLRTPTYPSTRLLEVEKPFSGTSMDWLGVKTDRRNAGSGVKVAILDTGVDTNHESLAGMKITEISLIKENGMYENLGHGTSIASVIAGQREDFLGLAPSSEILSIRVLNANGEGDSFTVAKGIIAAVDQGADLINLSLGGMRASVVMDNAIRYAKSNDVLLVSAVGNDGVQRVSYPARHNDVVAVASVDAKSRVSTFSNFGSEVDISAPGVGVITAWEENQFVHFSGTSIATAFVTGALASEISRSSSENKQLILNALYTNADETEKPGRDIWAGRGVINMRRLEQRNIPGIIDAAVVGYYFDPENIKSSGTTPFFITIQNQGTGWIQSTNLKVSYKGLEKNFRIGNLNAGESRSETLYFDTEGTDKKLHVTSELSLPNQMDQFPDNNQRKSVLIIP